MDDFADDVPGEDRPVPQRTEDGLASWQPLPDTLGGPPDLRIGKPERESARWALEQHHREERIDAEEYHSRRRDLDETRTRSELARLFADLPTPHPSLPDPSNPVTPTPSTGPNEEFTSFHSAMMALLGLGLPVAVVLGLMYDVLWVLGIPVAASVLMFLYRHSVRTAEQRGRNERA
ncbi:DUF1707 domain-containing protein [Micromonospora sp. NPDC050397]|uniref:DUF1707 SHOCT-like domain-containing protein n=1 Tax=Micromonospora sp. NPDC050397 TaxID=3364279 RepID=UPI0038506DCA